MDISDVSYLHIYNKFIARLQHIPFGPEMHGRLCLAAEPRLSSPSLQGIRCTTPDGPNERGPFPLKTRVIWVAGL